MLNGHTDTVGAGNMDIGPFDPVEKEGRVYGRGAADMKAGVTAMLAAAAAVARSGMRLQGDLIVAAVADEEYASIGTESLVKTHTADAAIVTEPTGLNIVVAHKGFAWIKYVTEGRAAHGSRPDEGIDAIMLMTEVLSELNALEQTALAGRTHPLLGRPSLHASLIRGGKELSTYPDCCELDVERRLIPGENRETVVREISEVMDRCRVRHPLFKGRAEMYFYRDALEIDRDAAIVRVLHQTAERRLGRSPHYSAMTGWMDSGILTPAGIPTVVFGPGGEGFHAAVEYAYTDQLVQCADILAQTAAAFCGVEE
jgi:acetylornithine deacetylase